MCAAQEPQAASAPDVEHTDTSARLLASCRSTIAAMSRASGIPQGGHSHDSGASTLSSVAGFGTCSCAYTTNNTGRHAAVHRGKTAHVLRRTAAEHTWWVFMCDVLVVPCAAKQLMSCVECLLQRASVHVCVCACMTGPTKSPRASRHGLCSPRVSVTQP